jgi:WD40 repeat protein
VLLWDLRKNEVARRFAHHRARIDQLAFAVDGSTLSIADAMQHVSTIDVATRSVRAQWHPSHGHERVYLGAAAGCVLVNQRGWRFALLHAATLAPEREVALEQVGAAPDAPLATDGKRLFTAGYGARACYDLICYDLDSGRRTYCVPMPRESGVHAITQSPDGTRLAVSDPEGRITVHAAADGTLQQVLADRTGMAGGLAATGAQLAFDRRGELLAAAGADGGLRVFDLASGVLLSAQTGHAGAAHAVALGSSGVLAATGGADRIVRLWSPFGGRDTRVLRGHSGAVRDLAIVPGVGDPRATAPPRSDLLVSVSEDGSLRLWDTTTGMPCGVVGGHQHHANTLAVTADGTRAYSTFHDGVVTTANPSLEQQPLWRTGGSPIMDLALAPDSRTLLAATGSGEVLLLDGEKRRVVRRLRGHAGPALACAFAAGGAVAYSGGQDGKLLRWRLAVAADADEPHVVLSGVLPIRAIAVAKDARSVFLVQCALPSQGAPHDDGAVRCVAADGAVLWERRCSSPPRSLALLPDEARLATGHDDGTVAIWDAVRGVPLMVRRLASAPLRALACDLSGSRVYAGAADPDRSCYVLSATGAIEPTRVRELAFAAAAMHLHAVIRARLGTSEETLAMIRAEPDPELRAFLETCERFSRLSWHLLAISLDLCVVPGLPREQYEQALRAAEASPQIEPRSPLATCVVFLANVRLGNAERALACVDGIDTTGEWTGMEPYLCAGRAIALRQLGRRAAAAAEAEQLRQLAALETASPLTIALWREVEATLR